MDGFARCRPSLSPYTPLAPAPVAGDAGSCPSARLVSTRQVDGPNGVGMETLYRTSHLRDVAARLLRSSPPWGRKLRRKGPPYSTKPRARPLGSNRLRLALHLVRAAGRGLRSPLVGGRSIYGNRRRGAGSPPYPPASHRFSHVSFSPDRPKTPSALRS